MSIHFHRLKIKEVRKETDACVSIAFSVPEELSPFFSFTQGQSITLRAVINGEDIRRSYSICSAPHENELRIAVKKVDRGLFSVFANDILKAGDEIDVLPPTGKFYTLLDKTHRKNYLALAAGSGITPIISIIKTTLQQEPLSSFVLIYGNRTRNAVIFMEELESIKNKNIDRFSLIHIFSNERTDIAVNFGRIDDQKLVTLEKIVDYTKIDEFFICGPAEMIFKTRSFFEQKGISKNKIHFELFATPGKKLETDKNNLPLVGESGGSQSLVTITLDGRSFSFYLAPGDDSILDAALKTGADLPYACKGGVCASCRARLVEGSVDMDMNWALEPEELDQGYILACQSHPRTKNVHINFDIR